MERNRSSGLMMATVGAALVGCLLVLATVSEPARATAHEENGRIAYSAYDYNTGGQDIYTIPSNGGTPTNLTDNPATYEYSPDWGVEEDTSAPTVASVKPADSKTRVQRGTSVMATFSEEMNPDTLTADSVFLINTKTGGAIEAKVSCDDPCKTVTINPWTRMAKNTKYKAFIITGAEDLMSNPLETKKVWVFTTGRR